MTEGQSNKEAVVGMPDNVFLLGACCSDQGCVRAVQQQEHLHTHRSYCYKHMHSLELFGQPVLLIELRPTHVFSLLLLLHVFLLHYLKQYAVLGSLLSRGYKAS